MNQRVHEGTILRTFGTASSFHGIAYASTNNNVIRYRRIRPVTEETMRKDMGAAITYLARPLRVFRSLFDLPQTTFFGRNLAPHGSR